MNKYTEVCVTICRGDVYVATVTGAICNCLPVEGERHNVSCQDYRLQSPESTVINAELAARARCSTKSGFYSIHVCSELATNLTLEGTVSTISLSASSMY